MIHLFFLAMIFLTGLAVGSFLNAFIYRLEGREGLVSSQVQHKLSVFSGRSFCPHCGHTLAWQDLIPLLSFVFLRGKCRYCREKISFQYPLVELTMGFLFLAIFFLSVENLISLSYPQALNVLYLWAVAVMLMGIFVYDVKHFLIPDKILYPAILLSAAWQLAFGNILNALPAALGAAGFFLLIYLASKGKAMGFGDVKLAFFMGLFLGFPNVLVALFLAFLAGALAGILLILAKKKTMRSKVPFGPFLVAGTLAALFFGEQVVDFYLSLLLV